MTERYVVDTSVVIQRLIVEANTLQVRRLFARMNQGLFKLCFDYSRPEASGGSSFPKSCHKSDR